MLFKKWFLVLLPLSLLFSCAHGMTGITAESDPSLYRLAAGLQGLEEGAQEEFWGEWLAAEAPQGLPLESGGRLVFLVWSGAVPLEQEGSRLRSLELYTSLDGFGQGLSLVRIGGSGLWTASLPRPDSDFFYHFQVTDDQGRSFLTPDPSGRDLLPIRNASSRWRQDPGAHGRVVATQVLEAPAPSKPRPLWVYLPPGYEEESDRRYPVFYWMEGQLLWDHDSIRHGGYKLETTLDRLIGQGLLQPLVVVGVPFVQADRGGEYMGLGAYFGLEVSRSEGSRQNRFLALNESFRRFMVETAKPYIDAQFRTKPEAINTAVGGGSFGGGISLTLALMYPHVFGKGAALATGQYNPTMSQWKDNPFLLFPRLVQEARQAVQEKRPGLDQVKLWIDCGTEDIDALFILELRKLNQGLVEAGLIPEKQVLYREFPGTGHHEGFWAQRVDQVLTAFF